jgi:acyl-CoA synthetase (AMP-forming)/AMP-acid ligase II
VVQLSHRNLLASARQIAASLGLTPEDRCLNVMPLFHITAWSGATLSTLTSGGSLVCSPGFQAASFFDWLDEFDPTWYTAVADHCTRRLLARATQLQWKGKGSLRFIRSSSSALPPR